MASFVLIDWAKIQFSALLVCAMLFNGAFFHFQSITEYALLEHITPVTHRYLMKFSISVAKFLEFTKIFIDTLKTSVANTVKRALLIWLSIILFGNAISLYSGMGTLAVIAGVLGYNKARQLDAQRIQRLMPDSYPLKIAL